MLSALRLQPLLRSVGLQLYKPRLVRVPSLRTARGMFSLSRLLQDCLAEREGSHSSVSPGDSKPAGTVTVADFDPGCAVRSEAEADRGHRFLHDRKAL